MLSWKEKEATLALLSVRIALEWGCGVNVDLWDRVMSSPVAALWFHLTNIQARMHGSNKSRLPPLNTAPAGIHPITSLNFPREVWRSSRHGQDLACNDASARAGARSLVEGSVSGQVVARKTSYLVNFEDPWFKCRPAC